MSPENQRARVGTRYADRLTAVLYAEPRSATVRRWLVAFALCLYACLLIYVIPRHEPWSDEAQAWQLAKYQGLRELFGTSLHYEFTPGLWHLCLWLLSRLHVSYTGMHWAAALIALAGVTVLITMSPFPLLVRLLLPFTYFFAFQYSVVARSYVLVAPLLFVLAHLWAARVERPVALAFAMGLVANASVHGLVIASGLAVVVALEWRTSQAASSSPPHATDIKARQGISRRWMSVIVFALLAGFAIWCLVPPPDSTWFTALKHAGPHPPAASLQQATSGIAALQTFPAPLRMVLRQPLRFADMISRGVSALEVLGLAAWLMLAARWLRERTLRYMLPLVLLTALARLARFSFYHAGLVWLLLLFLAWVTWPQRCPQRRGWSELGFLVALLLCIVSQLSWTAQVVRFDAQNAYAPDRAAAEILKGYITRGERVVVAVPMQGTRLEHSEFFATGLEPYFTTEPIANMRARFWIWKADNDMRATYLANTAARAAVVVMEQTNEDSRWPVEAERLQALGYRPAARVCGQNFYPLEPAELLCDAFYEPPR